MLLDGTLIQLLFLLGFMVFMVMLFQRAHIPASIAYLLVGVLLGAHTAGPVISEGYIHKIAEFGIVFLLFTIGLRFSWQQIYQLRHTILGLGTAQVNDIRGFAVAVDEACFGHCSDACQWGGA